MTDFFSNDNFNNIEIDSDKPSFKFANLEGPLDLLLYLIKKSKVEIEDVRLADITDQYIEMVNQLGKIDMERASDFIVVASELIEIKSRALLPRSEENAEDELDLDYLMKLRLKEYALFKEQSERLREIEEVNRFYKAPEKSAHKFRVVIKDMQLDMLLDAFTKLMHRINAATQAPVVKEIVKEKFTVQQKIASIKDALIENSELKFSDLFLMSISKDELITTFLALLELLKLQEIRVMQKDLFSDISIVKRDDDNVENEESSGQDGDLIAEEVSDNFDNKEN